MTAKEMLEKLRDDLFVANGFSLTKQQGEWFDFIFKRLDDLEKAETALTEIENAIAQANGLF